jgi:DNA-binding CsgD family transcriptional regulator
MNSEAGSRPLAELTLKAVAGLIPCDLVTFDNFSDQDIIPSQWHNNLEVLTPRITEVCSQVFEEHPLDSPLVREQVHKGYSGVLKLSDFGNSLEFAGTVFYNEVLRPINVNYQMGVVFSAGPGARIACSVNRRSGDFSERERSLLALAAPHLANSIGNAIVNEKLRENGARLEGLVESSARAVIVLAGDAAIAQMTGPAARLLQKYFAGEFSGRSLPEKLRRFAGGQAAASLSHTNPDGSGLELIVSKTVDPVTAETRLFLEEKRTLSPSLIQSLGLTPRQSEILYWISKGKTDDDIAELTGAGRRTVQKHLENIYRKLGVETRTAAAVSVIERLAL